jgi:hypothetical protein
VESSTTHANAVAEWSSATMSEPKDDDPIMEQEGLVNTPDDGAPARGGSANTAAAGRQGDPTENAKMGAAGHETGDEEPSAMGSAEIYATTIHEERAEAEEAGRSKADPPSR